MYILTLRYLRNLILKNYKTV